MLQVVRLLVSLEEHALRPEDNDTVCHSFPFSVFPTACFLCLSFGNEVHCNVTGGVAPPARLGPSRCP